MSVRTMVIEEHGGPEQFKMVESELGQPGPGEVLIWDQPSCAVRRPRWLVPWNWFVGVIG